MSSQYLFDVFLVNIWIVLSILIFIANVFYYALADYLFKNGGSTPNLEYHKQSALTLISISVASFVVALMVLMGYYLTSLSV